MTSPSINLDAFLSKIGNADATRRFIHDIAPAMSIDEGDHLTLATVSKGKNRKEAIIGRLDKGDESEIIAFVQREVSSRGEGRYKIRYTGANGRRNGSRTFTYPVEQKKPPVPAKAPMPPVQPPLAPARPLLPRGQSPSPRVAEPKPSDKTAALEAKVQELTTALTDLNSENSAVFQQLEHERAALAELREEIAALEGQLADAESFASMVENERGELEQDRDRLQIQLDQAEATAQRAESDRVSAEAERDQLLTRLHQAEADAAQQATRAKKLKAQLKQAASDHADLQRQLIQERSRPTPPDQTSEIQALQRRLERTTSERDRLKHSLSQHEQATAREIATCRKEIDMIEDDRLKLRARVLQLEKENERLQREIRSLEAENRAGADYIRQMRAGRDQDEDDDEGCIHYYFSDDDDDEDY